MDSRRLRLVLLAFALALIAVRLPHLGPTIDEPHAWRQMDTAQYIRAFAEDPAGVNLLRPSVSWMGPYRTLILEFPLPEGIAAWSLRLTGADPSNLLVPRLVFLAFFLAAVFGFFLLVRDLMGPQVAAWAALFYLGSPLSQAYSRAVHIDFTVLAFVHFATLSLLRGLRRESMTLVIAGSLLATVAALVKGPYLMAAVLALVPAVARGTKRSFLLKALVPLALPAVAFAVWRQYADSVNAAAPDWSFIPEYHRFVDMGGWYFGSLAQRLRFDAWRAILAVTGREVAGLAAIPLVLVGAFVLVRGLRAGAVKGGDAALAWAGGGAVYVLVFFNLSVVHDYYQIPLIAPIAILAALGAQALLARTVKAGASSAAVAVIAVVLTLNLLWAESRSYKPVGVTESAGRIVSANTPKDALVIASWPAADPRAPHLLYAAHRYGWSVRSRFLTPEIVTRLRAEGATHLALIGPESARPVVALTEARTRTFPFTDDAGTAFRLDLVDLRP